MKHIKPCSTCRFFKRPTKDDCINIPEKKLGYCINRAPYNYVWVKPHTPPSPRADGDKISIIHPGPQYYQTPFPVMEETDGCGEWKPEHE